MAFGGPFDTVAPGYDRTDDGLVIPKDDGEYRLILAKRRAKREEQDLRARVERLEVLVQELLAR